jgi:hypothetical protein
MRTMMVRAAAVVCLAAGLLAAVPEDAAATTYTVGIGQAYRELAQLPPLVPGDVVEVRGGFLYQPARLDADGTAAQPITIRGIRTAAGQRPIFMSGQNALELAGDHYVVEGLELTAAAVRCLYVHADDLVLRDLYIHDCPGHGIEGGGNGGGDLTLEYSEIRNSGKATTQHQIYVGTDEIMHPGSRFRMRFNYLHDANGGNNVKSRAERNEIYFNWIQGAYYHELELIGPDPADAGVTENQAIEHSDVVGNVLVKIGHSNFWTMRLGGDGTGQTYGRYRIAYNTILLASDSLGAFRLFDGIDTFEAHNNIIFRTSTAAVTPVIVDDRALWRSGRQVVGSHNWVVDAIVTGVPAEWLGTLRGANPGWNGFGDYRPLADSAVVDAADPAPAGVAGRPFPMPLPEPSFEPPLGPMLNRAPRPGEEVPRPRVGALDIGALEFGMGPPVDPDAGVGPGDGDGGVDPTGDGGTDPAGDGGGCCQTGRGAATWPAVLAVMLGLLHPRRRRS